MTNAIPPAPVGPPKTVDGKVYRQCPICRVYKTGNELPGHWLTCRVCDNSRLNESAMLPQASHKKNAVRRRLKP